MKPGQLHLFLFAAAIIWLTGLTSCKEKNEDFPPKTWYELSYADNSIPLRDISVILYESDHSLWLGAKGKEGLLYNDGYKWVSFDNMNTGISFDSVTSITRDGNDKLWVGFRKGLANFDGVKWSEIELFRGLCVTSIVVEGVGRIRVGIKGKSGGIATLNNESWEFESPENSTIPSGNINTMVSDNNQVLWLATSDKGIIRLLHSEWQNYSNSINLQSQNFTAITKSNSGNIWAASEASELIHFYNDTYSILTTGTSSPVSSIAVTSDDDVWCSTLGSGLIKFDGINWKSYTMANAELPSNDIVCLAKGSPGTFLFSIPGGKLFIINQ